MLEWEIIEQGEMMIERARVHGGWLVRSQGVGHVEIGIGLTFVPDPHHVWDLSEY